MMNRPDTNDALHSLCPGAQWSLVGSEIEWNGDSPTNLRWHSDNISLPSKDQILTELSRLQQEYDDREYQRIRAPQYPALADQLDMLWHAMDAGTLPKVDSFYSAIKAVKDANPKP
jgi:hypothetical protein